eukprot:g48370.t1
MKPGRDRLMGPWNTWTPKKKKTSTQDDRHAEWSLPFSSFRCPCLAADLDPRPRLRVWARGVSLRLVLALLGDPGLGWKYVEVLYWQHMKDRLRAQRKHQQMMIALRGRVIEELDVEAGNMEEELNDLQERAEDHLDNDGVEDGHIPVFQELFIANSQQYAKETALSLRVRDWEEKIGLRLEEQDERAPFDIHDYGVRIMDAFDCIRQRRSFASIVAGKEAFEVCRYMLATLQLAHDYTVDIWQKEGLYESVDTMELTLLSKLRAHE